MEAPNKLIGEVKYLATIQKPGKAGVITNQYGSILEANAEAAELLNVSSPNAMRNVLLVSYGHRASVPKLRNLFIQLKSKLNVETKDILLRPRGSVAFRAHLKARVIAKANQITIIHWEMSDAKILTNPSGEYHFPLKASG